jgi:ribosomal protein S14
MPIPIAKRGMIHGALRKSKKFRLSRQKFRQLKEAVTSEGLMRR